MQAIGASVALAPVLDITRDPRWGRVEETYGEDPYLAAVLGCAYVRGLQGDRPRTRHRRDRQAPRRARPGRGRVQPGARARRAARAARRAAAAVRGGRPRGRHRQRHARVLRPRRRSLPRVARAPDVDPPRRVGVRRRGRLRLHGGPDARRRAPPDAGSRHGGDDGAPGRHGQRAADDRRVRRSAPAGGRGRPRGRRPHRPRRRADPAPEVPARPLRSTRTSSRRPRSSSRPSTPSSRGSPAIWHSGR